MRAVRGDGCGDEEEEEDDDDEDVKVKHRRRGEMETGTVNNGDRGLRAGRRGAERTPPGCLWVGSEEPGGQDLIDGGRGSASRIDWRARGRGGVEEERMQHRARGWATTCRRGHGGTGEKDAARA